TDAVRLREVREANLEVRDSERAPCLDLFDHLRGRADERGIRSRIEGARFGHLPGLVPGPSYSDALALQRLPDAVEVTPDGGAVAAQYIQFVGVGFARAAAVPPVRVLRDHAERQLLAPAADQNRRQRVRLRLKIRMCDVVILSRPGRVILR